MMPQLCLATASAVGIALFENGRHRHERDCHSYIQMVVVVVDERGRRVEERSRWNVCS